MSAPVSLPAPTRFVGLDVHKQSIMATAVDAHQQTVLRPRRLSLAEFATWAQTHLEPTDAVVLEATTNAWPLYDLLQPLVASVTVVHSNVVQLITTARVKTDARDALHLARLLSTGLLTSIWVPPKEVRELRTLVAHRRHLIQQRTRIRNHLQSILHAYNLASPTGDPFAQQQRAWWLALEVPAADHLRIRQGWAELDLLAPLLSEVETELVQHSTEASWVVQVPYLVQVPGIGILNAMLLLASIGDITRFPTAKHLVSYSGLAASIHASGQTVQTGRITKEGRKDLRTTLVEAAWVAVDRHPHWKAVFQRLAARLGKLKAIVAVARKLLVVLWHVLSGHVADYHAEGLAVARKLFLWSSTKGTARRLGLSRAAFVRQHLDRLGIGKELTTFTYGTTKVTLPVDPSLANTG